MATRTGPSGARRPKGAGGVYQRSSAGMWIAAFDVGWTRSGARRRLVRSAPTSGDVA